jgi:hypothetical protein
MSVTVAYVFQAILLLLISIPAMTIAFHYPWKSLIHSRVFLDLLSTFLSYYDYLFLVCISVFSECIACVDKTILEQQVGIANDYLDTDSRVKSFGILEVVYSQSRLNSNVTCRGIDHIFLSLLSGLLLLGNFFLKYMNNFILSHRPNPLLPSKHNGGDMIHLSIVIAMMLLKVVLRFSGGQSILPLQIFYLTSLCSSRSGSYHSHKHQTFLQSDYQQLEDGRDTSDDLCCAACIKSDHPRRPLCDEQSD